MTDEENKGIQRLEESVDTLARVMVERFDQIDAKFGQVDLRFTRIDGELEVIKGKIDGTTRRIDAEVENRAQIETRVRKLEEVVFPS